MSGDQWIAIFAMAGVWSGTVITLILYQAKQRAIAIRRLDEKIDMMAAQSAAEHKAIAAHVATFQQDIANEYVRRVEFDREAKNLSDQIAGMRGDLRQIMGMMLVGRSSRDFGPSSG